MFNLNDIGYILKQNNFLYVFTVYANSMADNVNSLLYSGFIEELVDVLEIKTNNLVVRDRKYLYSRTSSNRNAWLDKLGPIQIHRIYGLS